MPITTQKQPFLHWKHKFSHDIAEHDLPDIRYYQPSAKYLSDFKEGIVTTMYELGDVDIDDYGIEDPIEIVRMYKKGELDDNFELEDGFSVVVTIYDRLRRNISHVNEGSPVWREMCVKKHEFDTFMKDLFTKGKTNHNGSFRGIGTSWSWEKEGAIGYNNTEGEVCVRLAAQRTSTSQKSPIDYDWTIAGGIMSQAEEKEIRMNKDQPLRLLQVCKKHNDNYNNPNFCKTYEPFAKKVNGMTNNQHNIYKIPIGKIFSEEHIITT